MLIEIIGGGILLSSWYWWKTNPTYTFTVVLKGSGPPLILEKIIGNFDLVMQLQDKYDKWVNQTFFQNWAQSLDMNELIIHDETQTIRSFWKINPTHH